jgi:uncharacterized lipoprotein YehR (DUF1307 family)
MKLKKFIALLLFVILSFSFTACGNGNSSTKVTKEELLETAIELDGYSFYQEYTENKVKLSSQYDGKACLVSGTVYEIEEDHIVVEDSNLLVKVYLPETEIIELKKNQFVEVVGLLKNMNFKQEMSQVWVTVDFNTAYLTKSIYTKTGEFYSSSTTDGTHPQGDYLKCVNDSGATYYVELVLTDEQKTNLTSRDKITIEGYLFENDSNMPYSASLKMELITIL